MPDSTTYTFGAFRLMPDQRSLTLDGQPVKLGGRAFDMLLALVERRDRTVSKHELLDIVWPRLVVEENNLQVQIVALRKLLGYVAIATVPGRGYRFTLPVGIEGPAVASGGVAPLPPPVAGVPTSRGTLYGRDEDTARVRGLLAPHRAVTIAGAGGVGKTRLAQAVAGASRTEFPDGICWVELATVADGALVPAAVAHALGLRVPDGRTALGAVLAAIGERRMLFVLDNCEQVLDGVSTFVDAAMAAAPDVRMLLTSQEVLRASDEHVYRLPPLDVCATVDVATVASSGAGALFCARAAAASPRFTLTPENVAAVAEICHQLDGIPLAIELAAARLPLLGIEGLRLRLRERFSVLTAGARIALRRHQTLRAALEWSHGLLSVEEQAVFRRMGIFVGGFTLELAQHVADDETMDPWDVLEHLGALVDKSLVVAEGEPVPRYRMLETTRLYALERLAEADETERLAERHAQALLALLTEYDHPSKRFRSLPAERAALARELDNVRAAVEWAGRGDPIDAMRLDLVGKSSTCFYYAPVGSEIFTRLAPFAPRVDASLPAAVRARYWEGFASGSVGSAPRQGYKAACEAAALRAGLGDDVLEYWSLTAVIGIGASLRTEEDLEPAITRAVALERPEWPPRLLALMQWARFCSQVRRGDFQQVYSSAVRQGELLAASGLGDAGRLIEAANVGYAEMLLDRPAAAEQRAREALSFANGTVRGGGHVVETLVKALVLQDRGDEAIEAARRFAPALPADGDELGLLEALALAAAEQGRLGDAAFVISHADAVCPVHETFRWPIEAGLRARLDALLAALPRLEREALQRQGALATMRAAFARAVGDTNLQSVERLAAHPLVSRTL